MQKSKLNNQYVFHIAFYVMLALGIAMIPFQVKRLLAAKKKTQELEQQSVQMNRELATESQYAQQKQDLEQGIVSLEAKMIQFSDIVNVIEFISDQAKECEVQISEMSPGQKKFHSTIEDMDFSQVLIDIEAEAQFHDLARFLNLLERAEHFLNIKKILFLAGSPYPKVDIVLGIILKEKTAPAEVE